MRKEKARSVFLSTLGLLITLSLMAGCYRPAAPDVTATPAGAAEAAETAEEMPDVIATARAESARATQAAEETSTVETPTESPPTPTPTSLPASPTPDSATPVPTEPAPAATAPPSEQVTHVVQHGENLFRIALRYGTTVEAIASANSITNPALISVGQKLIVPSSGAQPPSPAGETTYVVQPGDNLFRIALRYNLSYLYLAQYNGIANPSNIHTGQVLNIPPH